MSTATYVSTATKIYADLQSLARMRGRATNEILTIYGLERFVDRLTRIEFRDDFVLKGGILLAAYQLRRPTRDIDMQALDFPLDEAHLRAMVSAVAAVGVDDALVPETTNVSIEDIREDDDYAGDRVRIPARVHTHLFGFNLDVSTGDPSTTSQAASWTARLRQSSASRPPSGHRTTQHANHSV